MTHLSACLYLEGLWVGAVELWLPGQFKPGGSQNLIR